MSIEHEQGLLDTNIRTRPVLTSLVIVTLAAVPWIVAVLPLTFNGMQQVEESGTKTGSAALGISMLALAALPVVAALLALACGLTARVEANKIVQISAAALFFAGLVSFLFAMLLAMA